MYQEVILVGIINFLYGFPYIITGHISWNTWGNLLLYCKVFLQLHPWLLSEWSSQVLVKGYMYSIHRFLFLVFLRCNSMVNFLRNYEFSCRYTSFLAAGVGVLLFLLTSFSDPGTVKAENVSQFLSAYPYDNIIYFEKECSTCKIPKLVVLLLCCICILSILFWNLW